MKSGPLVFITKSLKCLLHVNLTVAQLVKNYQTFMEVDARLHTHKLSSLTPVQSQMNQFHARCI
jgi:hypothetical protein